MIVAKNLSKKYESKEVLKEVNLSVNSGEIVGIIGPNGCGKSTLMKLLSGAEVPTGGTVEINGKPIKKYKPKELARKLAVLQQEALPHIGFTVREIIEMGRYPYQNWMGEEITERLHQYDVVDQTIRKLNLTHLENKSIDNLSGGERQRVALGKVMAQEPSILMLDEPTTFLDIGFQLQMMEIVKRWQEECQLTVVVILHDLNIASLYCHKIIMIKEGKVEKVGTPTSVIDGNLIGTIYNTKPFVIDHPSQKDSPQIILNPTK
ncbi:ABC transporter ATP-binding protein [Anaerobacillus sp. CMMVII]|uniref:ABC transporter ATP-binding protein n=1 Tax=Anaerobacillus sp. CMMVII TaxID=2755588 RepID=UPI0021B7C53F|nr:ABC transporter ATP-binding protein [Anaerobacillus sp. CMMVII]MCT8137068.1 ABC transporter ATP-binding protein [Anaerobacillus sp. CMMVII]